MCTLYQQTQEDDIFSNQFILIYLGTTELSLLSVFHCEEMKPTTFCTLQPLSLMFLVAAEGRFMMMRRFENYGHNREETPEYCRVKTGNNVRLTHGA